MFWQAQAAAAPNMHRVDAVRASLPLRHLARHHTAQDTFLPPSHMAPPNHFHTPHKKDSLNKQG